MEVYINYDVKRKYENNPTELGYIINGYKSISYKIGIIKLIALELSTSGRELAVYVLENFNPNTGVIPIPKKECASSLCVSVKTIENSVNELIEKGFIIKSKDVNLYFINFDIFKNNFIAKYE